LVRAALFEAAQEMALCRTPMMRPGFAETLLTMAQVIGMDQVRHP
jgi:hypothetical protein